MKEVKCYKVSDMCKKCIYFNGKDGCWARKGKAIYGAYGCDFRPKIDTNNKGGV